MAISKAAGDIDKQAAWQAATYGAMNEHMPDGTGPDVEWLKPIVDAVTGEVSGGGLLEPQLHDIGLDAEEAEVLFRSEWDYPKDGTPEAQDHATATCSWMRILREEVAEAFASEDEARLRAELVQIAAVARNWVETIDRRNA